MDNFLTSELEHMIKKRDRLFEQKKDDPHKKKYKKGQATSLKRMRQAYWSYIEIIITVKQEVTNKRSGPKRFWTYIKHKKGNITIYGHKDKGILHTDPKLKADILNRQFQSVFSASTPISKSDFKKHGLCQQKPPSSCSRHTHLL